MRKITVATLVTCLWICGCDQFEDRRPVIETTQNHLVEDGSSVKVIEFDGHEYVMLRVYRGGGICHKANCKFCEE